MACFFILFYRNNLDLELQIHLCEISSFFIDRKSQSMCRVGSAPQPTGGSAALRWCKVASIH